MEYKNHYEYLDFAFSKLLISLGIKDIGYGGLIVAHGDKCYQYRDEWESAGLEFNHGVAIYLLTHVPPFSSEVRNTANGWVPPDEWVLKNKDRFMAHLSSI